MAGVRGAGQTLLTAGLVALSLAALIPCGARAAREQRDKSKVSKQVTRDKERDNASGESFCDLEISCRGGDLGDLAPGGIPAAMKLPIRGQRGPVGPPGEKGERGEEGLPGIPGLPGLSAPPPRRVAFFAGLMDNVGPVKEHKSVVFDRLVTNVGAAFDGKTGRFTAPVNGTYQFNVVVSAQGRQKAAVMLLKNGAMVVTVWSESIPSWASASNVAVLSLERDDQVWVLMLSHASYLHGYMYTTFSGFLLFEN